MTDEISDKDPLDFRMDNLIRSVFTNPCDAVAKALEEPAIESQARDPTPTELGELERLAHEAAALQDELKSHVDERPARLKALKDALLDQMLSFGMKSLKIHGRPPIEVVTSSSRKPTRKSIIEAFERQDPKDGKRRAIALWNAIEPVAYDRLSIPDPIPTDVEPPY